jgi:hypothetical protein
LLFFLDEIIYVPLKIHIHNCKNSDLNLSEDVQSNDIDIVDFTVQFIVVDAEYISCNNRFKGGWGWRISLGLGGIPALLLTLGAYLVVDTPNSLIERGHLEKGKAVLRKIRGTDNIEPEFLELVEASRVAKEVKHPFRNLLKRNNRPQLVISIALMVCTNTVFTFFIFLNIYNMITKVLNHGRNHVTIFIIA